MHGDKFLDLTPKSKATKTKINKWEYTKLKSLCIANETFHKITRQHTEWEKLFANSMSDKRLISKICGASLMVEMIKNLPTMHDTLLRSLGWEDPLEKEMDLRK